MSNEDKLRAALLLFIEATDLRDPCDLEDDTRAALNNAKRALGRVWAIRDDESETLWLLDPNEGSHIHSEVARYLFMSKAAADKNQRHWGGIVVEVTNV